MSAIKEVDPTLRAFRRKHHPLPNYKLTESDRNLGYYAFADPEKSKQGRTEGFDVLVKPDGTIITQRELDRTATTLKAKIVDYQGEEIVTSTIAHSELGEEDYTNFDYSRANRVRPKEAEERGFNLQISYLGYPLHPNHLPRVAIQVALPGLPGFMVWLHSRGLVKYAMGGEESIAAPPLWNFSPLSEVFCRMRYVETDRLALAVLDTEKMDKYTLEFPKEVIPAVLEDRAFRKGASGMRFNHDLPFTFERTHFVPQSA